MAENMIREKIEMFKEKVSGVRSRLPFIGERRILSDEEDEEGEEGILASFRSRVEERLSGIPVLSEFFGKEDEEEVTDGGDGDGSTSASGTQGGVDLSTGVSGGPELGIKVDERVSKTPGLIH